MRDLLTISALRCYRACPRRYWYRYALGVRAVAEEDAALAFGSLIHVGLEAWLRGGRAAALEAMASQSADEVTHVKAEQLLIGYDLRWKDAGLEVLAVESEFRADMVNPATGAPAKSWGIGGKIDAIVRLAGRDLVMEHKTTSEDAGPGTEYQRRLRLDGQVSLYFDGARALGFSPTGCLYDVLVKPRIDLGAVPLVEDGAKVVLGPDGQRVRTKDGKKWRETGDAALGYTVQTRPETLDEFRGRLADLIGSRLETMYQRCEVVRIGDELRDAQEDIWQSAQMLRAALTRSKSAGRCLLPRNPGACFEYHRPCAYLDVCEGTARIDDPDRFSIVENVHSELTKEESAHASRSPAVAA